MDDLFKNDRHCTIFVVLNCRGKKISDFSNFDESEVITKPGSLFTVVKAWRSDSGPNLPAWERADVVTVRMLSDDD